MTRIDPNQPSESASDAGSRRRYGADQADSARRFAALLQPTPESFEPPLPPAPPMPVDRDGQSGQGSGQGADQESGQEPGENQGTDEGRDSGKPVGLGVLLMVEGIPGQPDAAPQAEGDAGGRSAADSGPGSADVGQPELPEAPVITEPLPVPTTSTSPAERVIETPRTSEPARAAPTRRVPPEIVDRLVGSIRVCRTLDGPVQVRIGMRQDVFSGMQVRVSSQAGTIRTVMTVSDEATRAAVEAALPSLMEEMTRRGVQAEVTVEVDPSASLLGEAAGEGRGDDSGGASSRDDDSRNRDNSRDFAEASVEGRDPGSTPVEREAIRQETNTDYAV